MELESRDQMLEKCLAKYPDYSETTKTALIKMVKVKTFFDKFVIQNQEDLDALASYIELSTVVLKQ